MWFLERKVLLTKDSVNDNGKDVHNVSFVVHKHLMNILLFHVLLHNQFGQLFDFTFSMPPSTNIANIFVNWVH
jgi:hypothetical protein